MVHRSGRLGAPQAAGSPEGARKPLEQSVRSGVPNQPPNLDGGRSSHRSHVSPGRTGRGVPQSALVGKCPPRSAEGRTLQEEGTRHSAEESGIVGQ